MNRAEHFAELKRLCDEHVRCVELTMKIAEASGAACTKELARDVCALSNLLKAFVMMMETDR